MVEIAHLNGAMRMLVYNNYTKVIAVADTVRKVRQMRQAYNHTRYAICRPS